MITPFLNDFARGIVLGVSICLGTIGASAAPKKQPAEALTAEGQQLQSQYEAMLGGLRMGFSKAVPAIDEGKKASLQQSREIGRAHV